MALGDHALIDIPYLRQMASDVSLPDDEVLEGLINQASTIAETKTRRRLKQQTLSVVLDPPPRNHKVLQLPEYPVSSITGIYVDPLRVWGAATEVTAYYLDEPAGQVHREAGWGTTLQSIKVDYAAGFSPVPEDLQEAAVELVLWLMSRQRAGKAGHRTVRDIDGLDVELEISMPLQVQRTLSDYGRVA